MDYAEEQQEEIDALEAILMDEFKEIDDPLGSDGIGVESRTFTITIAPKDADEEEPTEIPVRIELVFAHTPKYPEEPPLLRVRSLRGVRDSDIALMQRKVEAEAKESLGMAMIYNLAIACKEWFREIVQGKRDDEGEIDENDTPSAREEREQKALEAKRKQGTPVTPVSWTAWFDRFRAEVALHKAKLQTSAELERKSKMNGKQYFENRELQRENYNEGEDDEDDFDDYEMDEGMDEDALLDQFLAERGESALQAGQEVVAEAEDEN
ncbi:hypothetical protein CYMTET_5275 [Cymbomonas tetramitiformis]|uniref:RWD domain-containing protein n=1 Tax=Cymbomonas tetramitiformis TaxID=36881 RepID=A0AAE0GZR3_9CHLO|nr:hypothetical protein CYMTET_5275 [Cymbomonas tetramitiformis]